MQQDLEAKHTGLMRSGWQKELLKAFIFATIAKYLQESTYSGMFFKKIFVIYNR